VPIDTSEPLSDGWLLDQLYRKLRKQQKHAEEMYQRFRGDPPMPDLTLTQQQAVQQFMRKARTNFERLIVKAVLDRLKIRGIRTAVDPDEGGDAVAFSAWKRSRGKMWSKEAQKYALSMGIGFVAVGLDSRDRLLVTAEDPRHVAVLTDPADSLRVLASIKLIYDSTSNQDIAYFMRLEQGDDGREIVRQRIAVRSRAVSTPVGGHVWDAQAFDWSVLDETVDGPTLDVMPEWLQETDDRPAMIPFVPFENEDGMAEFEPHIELLDRITQQILQRMTIATIQAFKQRAIKGLPKTDSRTGDEIDYSNVFTAEPGAIWQLPATAEIWESGEVNLQGILLSVRDDIKDLAAVSGTPLYTVTPDVANGTAEGASLQRETLTFKVEDRQDRWELPQEMVAELIFRTAARAKGVDPQVAADHMKRSEPGTIEIMWRPADRPSMSERANAIAQTQNTIPKYIQLTEIWGLDPAQADRAMTMLQEDAAKAAALAQASAPPPAAPQARPTPAPTRAIQPREQGAAPPNGTPVRTSAAGR
jgi:hypothetical protein